MTTTDTMPKVLQYAAAALRPHPANPPHRSDAGFEDLAERIRAEGGITEPLTIRIIPASEGSANTYGEVLSGARRLAAAQLLGMMLVPVRVVDVDDATAHRMVLAANLDRLDFTETEQADLVQGALDLGMSEQTLAEQLGKGKEWIARRRAVAQLNAPARKVLDQHPEIGDDLTVVAKIAEFASDDELVEELTALAKEAPERLDHLIESERRDRAEGEFIARTQEAYREAGYEILTERPWNDANAENIVQLSPDGSGKELTSADHDQCAGRAVIIGARLVDDTDGYSFAGYTWEYCLTWKTAGHYKRFAQNTATATSGPQPEKQKAERRKLIETNKAAQAAQKVRTDWIRAFLARDKMPADALQYVEEILHEGRSRNLAFSTAGDFLPASARTSEAKVTHRLVGLAIAHVEQTFPKDYWRTGTGFGYELPLFALHLKFLSSWGYGLAPHESDVVKKHAKAGKR